MTRLFGFLRHSFTCRFLELVSSWRRWDEGMLQYGKLHSHRGCWLLRRWRRLLYKPSMLSTTVVASSRRRKEVESRMWALFYPSTYTQSLTIITLNVWTFIWYHRQPSGTTTTTTTASMKNMCRPRPDHARVAGWLALNGDSQWGRSL